MHTLVKATMVGLAGFAVIGVPPGSVQAQTATTTTNGPRHAMSKPAHRIIIQVTQNDPAVMNMALNNAENLEKFYQDKGEPFQIELVAYGAGLNIFRADTSPVKERLASIANGSKNISFSGCGNTLANQSRQESKPISLVPEAHIVPTGIARVVELEEQGWTYVRP